MICVVEGVWLVADFKGVLREVSKVGMWVRRARDAVGWDDERARRAVRALGRRVRVEVRGLVRRVGGYFGFGGR